jgi:hypothetical protein
MLLKFGIVQKSYLKNSSANLKVWGGDVQYSNFVGNSTTKAKWIASIRDNPVFYDFAPRGLVPIWSFCSNSNRSKAIQNAYAEYAVDQGKNLTFNCDLPKAALKT